MLVCERLYCGVLNSLIYKGVREMPVKSRDSEGESWVFIGMGIQGSSREKA